MTENNNLHNNSKDQISNQKEICTTAERIEYFGKLEQWLLEFYAWQTFVSTFPYYLASSQIFSPVNPTITVPSNIAFTFNTQNNNQDRLTQQRLNEAIIAQFQAAGIQGYEYRVPAVWKRFVAELIDSLILFLIKLLITLLAVDIFDFVNLEKYSLDLLRDYKMAVELTSGILILELIHRVSVCIFEAAWLQHGMNGTIGGATPGKKIMGLKVVLCKTITPIARLDNNIEMVFVSPGTDLGFSYALGRSLLKNIILAFFFPVCFALCFFKFNRTGYDLICHTIVVEDPYSNGNNNNLIFNNNNPFNIRRIY